MTAERNVAERLLVEELRDRGWPNAVAYEVSRLDEEGDFLVQARIPGEPNRHVEGRVLGGRLASWRFVPPATPPESP